MSSMTARFTLLSLVSALVLALSSLTAGAGVTLEADGARAASIGKISGLVLQNGRKVPGASVRLATSGGTLVDSTTTDITGRFGFTDLAPGNYNIFVSKFDNGAWFIGGGSVTVNADQTTSVTITLHPIFP